MVLLTTYLLVLAALATVVHGNGWCNQPAFQKYSISSPLLFSCDDSDLKTQIAALQKQSQEACSNSESINQQLLTEIQQLKQMCNISTLTAKISQLSEEINVLKDSLIPVGSVSNPATNCREISQKNDSPVTGMYWLNSEDGVVNVTCEFDVQLPPPSPVRGWQEITNIDMSNPTESCPSPLRESNRRCGKSSNSGGCESVFFPTNRVPFTKLCGRVVGYSGLYPDAFEAAHGVCSPSGCRTIDDPYIDGMSITYSKNNSRTHIWSFAADYARFYSYCPCGTDGFSAPSFVGNDYYCEVSQNSNSQLWEGEGCTDVHADNGPCCENPNLPWFCREFNQTIVTDNIEVRVCLDQDRSDEDIQFDLMKLYIQ